MSGYSIQQYPDEPILLVTYLEDWDTGRDLDPLHELIWEMFDSEPTPVFYIVDVTIEPRFTLDDVMMVTRKVLRGSKPLLRHPNMRENLVVTHHPVLQHAVKALPWGFARSFETLDDALAYARAKLAE